MDHDNGISNKSGNRPFQDVLRARASRRSVIAGGLATAATGILAPAAMADGWKDGGSGKKPYRPRGRNLIGFEPVPVEAGSGPEVSISSDYSGSAVASVVTSPSCSS